MIGILRATGRSEQESDNDENHSDDSVQIFKALQSEQAVIEFELDGTIIRANDSFLRMMGYTLEELVGRSHKQFFTPDEATTSSYASLWGTLRSGRYVFDRCRHHKSKGGGLWLQAHYIPIRDNNDRVHKVVEIATDITAQSLQLAEFEDQVTTIRENLAVIEFTLDGMVTFANENFLNATGYRLEEIKDKHHRQFVDPAEHDSAGYKALWEQLNSGTAVSDQFRRMNKRGEVLWLQAIYCPVFDSAGIPTKVVKYASDITLQKSLSVSLDSLVKEAGCVMGAIAKGDLTKTMQGRHSGDLAELSHAINVTVEQLKSMMRQIIEHSAELVDGSRQLSELNNSSQQAALETAKQTELSSSTALQISSSVSSVAASLEQMSSAIHGIAENSSNAVSVAEKAVELSNEAKINVSQLSNSSNAINAVIKVINSIADQTNLLALNATIEAARAGDAGRGFAVVANEVKELAKETARATEDVSNKITKIQSDSQAAEQIIGEISDTIEQINASQVSIASTVEEQRSMSSHISQSINETARGNNEIAESTSETAKVAKENLHRAEESQQTTRALRDRSDKLSELAGRFIMD